MKYFLSFAVGVLFLSPAFAAKEGHGGKGIVCRDVEGKIVSATLLDFYEAEAVFNEKIVRSDLDYADQLYQRLDVMVKNEINFVPDLYQHVDNVETHKRLVPADVVLMPVDDALIIAEPRGCKAEQLANYIDDQTILISEEIWNALPQTDKAGLILHEAIYRYERGENKDLDNSRHARSLTAFFFSDRKIESPKFDHKDAYHCTTWFTNRQEGPHTSFFVFNENNKTQLQFYRIESREVVTKKTAVYDGTIKFWDYEDKGYGNLEIQTESTFESGDKLIIQRDDSTYGTYWKLGGTYGGFPRINFSPRAFSCSKWF